MWKEFRDFAMKGNVLDLAIGVIIGGAFGKIISSLVNDIIMPLVGILLGNVNFANLFFVLGEGNFNTIEEAEAAGVVTVNYGLFLNNIIGFLIIAFTIFIVIRQITRFTRKKAEAAEETAVMTKQCKYCLNDIHKDASRCPYCTASLD